MHSVFDASFPVFALILAGYVCGRQRLLGSHAVESLNLYVVWLALPALLIEAMARITWDEIANTGFLLSFGTGMAAAFLLSLALSRRRRQRVPDAGLDGLCAAYGNTAYMGLPVCTIALGAGALAPAIVSSILTGTILFGIGIMMIEAGTQTSAHASPYRAVAVSLARNPLIVSPAIGALLAICGLGLPGPFGRSVAMLGQTASPCALVTIGLFLAEQRGIKQPSGPVATLVAIKLVLQPAVTWVLAVHVFTMSPLWSHSAVLLAAMPTGTGPFMLAKLYGRSAGTTSRAILLSTVLSMLTIPLLLAGFAAR